VDVKLGNTVKLAVSHEVVKLLGDDGSCVHEYEENHTQNDDSWFLGTYDWCMYAELYKQQMREVRK